MYYIQCSFWTLLGYFPPLVSVPLALSTHHCTPLELVAAKMETFGLQPLHHDDVPHIASVDAIGHEHAAHIWQVHAGPVQTETDVPNGPAWGRPHDYTDSRPLHEQRLRPRRPRHMGELAEVGYFVALERPKKILLLLPCVASLILAGNDDYAKVVDVEAEVEDEGCDDIASSRQHLAASDPSGVVVLGFPELESNFPKLQDFQKFQWFQEFQKLPKFPELQECQKHRQLLLNGNLRLQVLLRVELSPLQLQDETANFANDLGNERLDIQHERDDDTAVEVFGDDNLARDDGGIGHIPHYKDDDDDDDPVDLVEPKNLQDPDDQRRPYLESIPSTLQIGHWGAVLHVEP
jgi:hypothetical protein